MKKIKKVALAIFVTACVLLGGTYLYISAQLPAGVKAIAYFGRKFQAAN